ncbi:MAG: DUF503 domain-containing protein [Chloroflexota bacterium]
MSIIVGVLSLHLRLPGCGSLKEKRGRLMPLKTQLRKKFNLTVAEIDYLDVWQDTLLACAVVSNELKQSQSVLQKVSIWVDEDWSDVQVVSDQIEIY